MMKTLPLDAYVVDTLMRDLVGHDHKPSAYLVYLLLWRSTWGEGVGEVEMSLGALAEATGLSKRSVQDAITRLSERRLIGVHRESITAVSRFTVKRPWIRAQKGRDDR
jgi:hypothetical protein